ncbi:WG repeat-containing protein [Phaeocystidibacter luteus]|uniref:WG repeat-containing protein n=1 Tax=Phaeocystidibacter luteus TaxID=911197 RepID=A0A6N6RMB6_9FLAO|nr:WG repeat-containing protein [Phaeocystidibacter luteus]KAB2814744.1 WG repeat-containing protein [Phaeocystidibacter luteus]
MRPHLLYTLAILASAIQALAVQPKLFPCSENQKWGYIDIHGDWAIEPQYDLAEVFTEGIAAVRQDGFYFYINDKNERLHTSAFVYAYPFTNGLAIVMEGEHYHLINADFERISAREYTQIYRRPSGIYIALINNEEVEVLDENGESILPPSAGSTWPFGTSLFVRHESNDVPGEIYNYEGQHIMSIGDLQAGACNDAYFVLQKSNSQGLGVNYVYTSEGEMKFTIPDSLYFYHSRHYTQSPTPFEKYSSPINSYRDMYDRPRHWGLLHDNGHFQPLGDSITNMTYMENDRCFAEINQQHWILLDEQGKQVSNKRFNLPPHYLESMDLPLLFTNGKALVEFENRWVLINRNGDVTLTGPNSEYHEAIFQIMDGKMALFRHASDNNKRTYWNLKTGDTSKAVYDRIFVYNSNYMGCLKDGEMTFVLSDGTIVYPPSTTKNSALRPLNIAAKFENWVTVGSPPLRSTSGYGGWGNSRNGYQAASHSDLKGELQVIRSEEVIPWKRDSSISARKVTLVNGTKDTIFFEAQDSRLYTVVEAVNGEGEWLPIENFRSSWCGNSYHTVYLPPNKEWTWTVPEFDGGVETEFRIRVYKAFTREYDPDKEPENDWDYTSKYSNSEPFEVYSATWTGRLNPSQFYREMSYSPSGIMDPY